ncbi:hypothetical protein CCAX7_41460 [Capsulimonas corticalis]|uniref:Uncharacterized protein n=1 Tax=Capsulimonas corticalis TaxID=2219043 RepID=A0A402CY45_9BACT|nr:AraC family transcriptional regulator [Capsulimonas corticalis]BDI32095.1 hypothetical protein CCAX7_41460 [Capsulimonas corticalis]
MGADFVDGKIDVVASGIRPSHPPDFKIDWPVGNKEYGFVQFHEPVILEDCAGRRERPAGTCIVYMPFQPRYYRARQGSLEHTWILAIGSGVSDCLAEYAIPTNTALELGELEFLEPYIHSVRLERLHLHHHYEDAITDLSREFLRRIGVLIAQAAEPLTVIQRRRADMLNEIRLAVHSDMCRRWTVPEMAAISGLNATRFATEYTKQFGASPIDDLIDARLRRAEFLLKHRSLTVKQISVECGFTSPEHFNRLFHARRGYSPGQFRKL